ncbi:hypothetical protein YASMINEVIRUS_594 [Yasminevirus sp. GU-2018]|uniref:Uncharacterized protein n=1 Tax=Yasminevirus sp. GU-2018 TaxID=2420051 RepID=A0A5K0U998_9VIRU|nr:hypothetical protein YASMINEVIRUS_594 [Yasminevirus sp. GU-2018]
MLPQQARVIALLNGHEKDVWEHVFKQIEENAKQSQFSAKVVLDKELYLKYYDQLQFDNFDGKIKIELLKLGYKTADCQFEENDTVSFSVSW